jgi:hypothetical protein
MIETFNAVLLNMKFLTASMISILIKVCPLRYTNQLSQRIRRSIAVKTSTFDPAIQHRLEQTKHNPAEFWVNSPTGEVNFLVCLMPCFLNHIL